MIEKVKDTNSGNAHENALQPKSGQQVSLDVGPPKTWPIIVTGASLLAVAIGGVYTIVRVASVFNEIGVIATFITGSIVGLFTLLAIIVQAAIYWQQRNFMMRQWKEMRGQLLAMEEQAKQSEQALDLSMAEIKILGQQAEAALLQSKLMAESLEETRRLVRQNERAVAASESSAKAAEQAAETAVKNMVYAQRSYVSVVGGGIIDHGHGFKIVIKNCGNTPATTVQVRYYVDAGYTPPNLTEHNWTVEFVGVLAPDGTYDIGAKWLRTPTTEKQQLLGTDANYHLWCVGEIWYYDFFLDHLSDPRVTKFCIYREAGNPLFRAWVSGNEAT